MFGPANSSNLLGIIIRKITRQKRFFEFLNLGFWLLGAAFQARDVN